MNDILNVICSIFSFFLLFLFFLAIMLVFLFIVILNKSLYTKIFFFFQRHAVSADLNAALIHVLVWRQRNENILFPRVEANP